MKRTLTIAIDANRVTCGRCRYVNGLWCDAFNRVLQASPPAPNLTMHLQRCDPCLAAEVKP